METPTEAPKEARNSRRNFREYFKSRSDIGFWKLLLDIPLEARDPFKPWEPRKWKKGFLAGVLVVSLAAAWFVYWNFLN